MNPTQEHPLTTADLANVDEVRGRRDEPTVGREGVSERDTGDAGPLPRQPANTEPTGQSKTAARTVPEEHPALFPEQDSVDLRKRWGEVQGGFVDEPRRAVEQADALVADVMKRLA